MQVQPYPVYFLVGIPHKSPKPVHPNNPLLSFYLFEISALKVSIGVYVSPSWSSCWVYIFFEIGFYYLILGVGIIIFGLGFI